jgi:nanoRNase/pAp phosphatase (c-di-AMP/oligoRNAs hydrolase)
MTISLEALKRVTQIYVHKHCPDGMASAMILNDAFRMLGKKVPIYFIAHNTSDHDSAGLSACGDSNCEMVLFCDMTPSRKFMKLYGARENFIVLDHHSKQEDIVRAFGDRGVYADAIKEPGVSGAMLALREVWDPINRETGTHDFILGTWPIKIYNFATDVGARDTFQTKSSRFLPGSWTAQTLMSKSAGYWLNPRGSDSGVQEPFLHEWEVRYGQFLFEVHTEAVAAAVKQCVFYEIEDKKKGAVELFVFQERTSGFRLTSDVAEALRQPSSMRPQKPAVVAGFSFVIDQPCDPPVLLYSLRGIRGYDVGALAVANGGGGHDLAAGFSVPIRKAGAIVYQDPYETIRERVERFLLTGDGWATPYKEKS